jgi:pimeloyl-ACP methyl ester carboxylesterase
MQSMNTIVRDTVISASLYESRQLNPRLPLLVALHGGAYTHKYFAVAGSSAGSFIDIATRNGFSVLAIDRPGYGASALIPEEQNTFGNQAAILDEALAALVAEVQINGVVVVGHSIGGMIALEIAARRPAWNLIGVSVTGMGARIPRDGAAEAIASLPYTGVVDLPLEERERLWYGPAGSYTHKAVSAARDSYAPAPMVELVAAPQWAARRLPVVAAAINVPVHHALAEFDALWDSSPAARDQFLKAFSFDLAVQSQIVPGVGHSIEHHLIGASVAYNQLAFAHMCWCTGQPEYLGTA